MSYVVNWPKNNNTRAMESAPLLLDPFF
jgi:hypothetical protein